MMLKDDFDITNPTTATIDAGIKRMLIQMRRLSDRIEDRCGVFEHAYASAASYDKPVFDQEPLFDDESLFNVGPELVFDVDPLFDEEHFIFDEEPVFEAAHLDQHALDAGFDGGGGGVGDGKIIL
ncbi:hypothetical protein PR202_ga04337 [Eleusine coracana subsp. coracana]|uniref:Uncharacterized protein n=1 Tax=Eleusine coracana subsp. coracana TaxID=191504 RepID=A0AAV5BQT2_ELECO|nr:hypothetical protein PR202_ga04337 [Eleusine coracana subsp. coracana]